MNKKPNYFQKILEAKGTQRFVLILRAMAALVGTAVLFLIAANTVLRYCFHHSLIWVEEILTVCAVWMYMLGCAIGTFEESHVKGDLVSDYLTSKKAKKWLTIVVHVIGLIVFACLSVWSIEYCMMQGKIGTMTAYLRMPMLTSQLALPVCLCISTIFWAIHLLKYITMNSEDFQIKKTKKSKKKADNVEITEGGE